MSEATAGAKSAPEGSGGGVDAKAQFARAAVLDLTPSENPNWRGSVMSEPQGVAPEAGADPIALGAAMGRASPTVDAELISYLHDQRHHLHEQLNQIHLDVWEKKLGVLLRLATLCVGLTVIAGLGIAMWNAAQADGLVVESLSVPPRFAEAGITGGVLSDDLNNKLGAIRDLSDAASLTRSSDVSANRDDEFKVEIPETGVSLGQAWHYLRLWLGHERRLTGNLRELGDGRIALTATLTGSGSFTASGPAANLDRLEQQAAEHVYQQVDPINYVIYLEQVNRAAEASAAAERAIELARNDSERANALGLSSATARAVVGDIALSVARARLGIAVDPRIMPAYRELVLSLVPLGHDEEVLHTASALQTLKEKDQLASIQGRGFRNMMLTATVLRDLEMGDFTAAAAAECPGCPPAAQKLQQAEYAARAHDLAQSRARLDEFTALPPATGASLPTAAISILFGDLNRTRYYQHTAAGDWQGAASDARARAAVLDARNVRAGSRPASRSWVFPQLAIAEARAGDMARAQADADTMPMDCYACLRARGGIAGLERNGAGADAWFARAVAAGPSLPFAHEEWGRALLDRRQPDAAIAQFKLANQKGPHFADPLEGWGEALMAKNQSHLALAKFAEAEKYAPNWGRLHLKWGEALVWAGKPDEAKKRFARAAELYLTPSEKAEFPRQSPHA
jgi:tetratricopeptide (TPR) repeat protein